MPRTILSPIALAGALAERATLEVVREDPRFEAFRCPLRLSDGTPCTTHSGTRSGLERHLLDRHCLNSRKGYAWRDAYQNAAKHQGCEFVRVWGAEDAADLNQWPGVAIEARVGLFLWDREAYVGRAGFACERVEWKSRGRTYVFVDAGLYQILASAFESAPTFAEAQRIGHMILNEAWRARMAGGDA